MDEQNKEDTVGSNFEPEIKARIQNLEGATAKGRVKQPDAPAFVLGRFHNFGGQASVGERFSDQ